MTIGTKRVLLIGWDAADWKIIHRLVDEGKMPCMAGFIEGGVIGNLATLYPELSPMLWTSIATGKRPHKHGILGFTEPSPESGGVRPITNISRKTRAIWNILGMLHMKSVVIGWWPSHPAEPINGVMVSNHFQKATAPHGKPWPMGQGIVHPPRLAPNLARLRLHPQDVDPGAVLDFVPGLDEIDQDKDHRIEALAKIMAECATVNRAALAVLHHEPWQFAAVYYDGIDHFCHAFMNYHPPRLPWVREEDYEKYRRVVEKGYILHDRMLASLLDAAGEDTTVMIVSDHGFHSDHLRPRHIPVEPAGPAEQHRPYGIFALKGPGIKKDEVIYGASLLDVCPTILTLCGLPAGSDMDGKPLVNIFTNPPEIRTIESWDLVQGEDGRHAADSVIDPLDAKEALDQLVALGYIEKPDDDKEKAARECTRELQYNLARSYMETGLGRNALSVFKVLYEGWPGESRFGIQVVQCLLSLDMVDEAETALEEVLLRKREIAKAAREELKGLQEKYKDAKAGELGQREQYELRKLRAQSSTSSYAIEYLRGSVLLAQKKADDALLHFKKAERISRRNPSLYDRLGESFVKLKRWTDAEDAYTKSLELDPDNAEAHTGLARVALAQRRFSLAARHALNSAGLRFHNPNTHYILGTALHRMGRISEALQALQVAVAQSPAHVKAHHLLALIYRRRLNDNASAERHEGLAGDARAYLLKVRAGEAAGVDAGRFAGDALTSDGIPEAEARPEDMQKPYDPASTVLIVSGLPRSGTSMMMQMLKAGGVEPLTDGKRDSDDDNPRGYYEHDSAKKLRGESAWIADAGGKAVKIVAQLLPYLPAVRDLSYRVIFMNRDLDEVLASQKVMIERRGEKGAGLPPERLKKVFQKQIHQAMMTLRMKHIPSVFIEYGEATSDPRAAAARVNGFLGGSLDEQAMAAAVDRSLHRQRSEGPPAGRGPHPSI
ncbi:MAG: alkaline phosphatase family protein [Nitrospiraceae bacterium]|nr:alkaline phosphatase family protein [Nitrospiraceae bacterium]